MSSTILRPWPGFDPEPALPEFAAVDGESASRVDATISPQRSRYRRLRLKYSQVVEDLGAARNALRIVLGRDADAFDQRPDAGDFGAAELAVLEIDVMDDFRD